LKINYCSFIYISRYYVIDKIAYQKYESLTLIVVFYICFFIIPISIFIITYYSNYIRNYNDYICFQLKARLMNAK